MKQFLFLPKRNAKTAVIRSNSFSQLQCVSAVCEPSHKRRIPTV